MPCTRQNLHVQALCDATYTAPDGSTQHGTGILEQLAIGVHRTGLTGIFDPFTGPHESASAEVTATVRPEG
jgi:hypothetical protein